MGIQQEQDMGEESLVAETVITEYLVFLDLYSIKGARWRIKR